MAVAKTSKKGGSAKKHQTIPKKSGAATRPKDSGVESKDEVYVLTAERREELMDAARALGSDVVFFPGRARDRVRWAHRIRIAAERDALELVRAPFHDEPPLTREEIAEQRDHIELFRATESEFQAKRAGQAAASKEFASLAAEAASLEDRLLRAFDLRFRNEPEGQKRLSQIRAGAGDTDLVQDVSDLSLLATQHMAYLESCPRGEAAAARRLIELSPELSHLLGAKTISEEARAARQVRDAAFTLVTYTERRIRAAAEYWYAGTEKMKEYAVYVAPATGAGGTAVNGSDGASDSVDPAPPTPRTGTPGGAPQTPR